MLRQYEPIVKAAIVYLQRLGVKVHQDTVNAALQDHPDWPSLLCISDSFNKWDIPHAAGRIAPEQLQELPCPFIAYTNSRSSPIAVVTAVSDTTVTCYWTNYNKSIAEDRENFLRDFTGFYLVADPTEQSGEKEYTRHKQKAFFQTLLPLSLIALILGISSWYIQNIPADPPIKTAAFIQYLLLLSGIVTTVLLLWYDIDRNNPFLKKVCTGVAQGNCEAVLTSGKARVFKWLSWSEAGFFYFAGGWLTLVLSGGALVQTLIQIAWLNILALPYTVFSVYYQAKVVRQWCLLCLIVQTLLWIGALHSLLFHLLKSAGPFSPPQLLKSLVLYLSPALLWYTVKPFLLRLQEAKTTKRDFLRIKFNRDIFETLLARQKPAAIGAENIGIDLGNPAARHTLIKVCNPYCGPCAKMHPKIEQLLKENPDIKAKIIFTAPCAPDHPAYKPVSHLLAIAAQDNDALTRQALHDWYMGKEKDYDTFAGKYHMNGELKLQDKKIKDMYKWCEASVIEHTPTLFLDGHRLPDAYSIEDLTYFLNH